MQDHSSNCKEDVTDSLLFPPPVVFVVVLGQWYIPVCAFFLPHMHNTCGSWESRRRWFFSLSFMLFILLILPPLPSEGIGQWKKEFNQIYAFLCCTAVCVVGYYNWVCFYCPLTKVPSYFLVPSLLWQKDNNMHMICFCFSYLQIVSGSGADQLQFVFWSYCLGCFEE